MNPDIPRGPGLFEVTKANSESLITNVRRITGTEREPGSLLVGWSTALLALLDAGLFYVSWWGQFLGSGPYFVTVTSPRAGSSLAILNDPGRYGT